MIKAIIKGKCTPASLPVNQAAHGIPKPYPPTAYHLPFLRIKTSIQSLLIIPFLILPHLTILLFILHLLTTLLLVLHGQNQDRFMINSFSQFVFDNADFNSTTLDGLNTVGAIRIVTPDTAVLPSSTIAKLPPFRKEDIAQLAEIPVSIFQK